MESHFDCFVRWIVEGRLDARYGWVLLILLGQFAVKLRDSEAKLFGSRVEHVALPNVVKEAEGVLLIELGNGAKHNFNNLTSTPMLKGDDFDEICFQWSVWEYEHGLTFKSSSVSAARRGPTVVGTDTSGVKKTFVSIVWL